MASSTVKEPPEATATPEPLSDEDLTLDPDLYQDFCAGAFDDHGLVSTVTSLSRKVKIVEAEILKERERNAESMQGCFGK